MRKYITSWLITALLSIFVITPVALAGDYYVVRSGDSLWKIARLHNTTVDRLMALNNLSSDRLQIGDRLKVRGGTPSAPRGSSSRGQVTRNSQAVVYVVQMGDSLWSIAQQHGMTVSDLKALNNLSGELLHPGDKLVVRNSGTLPVSVQAPVKPASRAAVAPSRGADTDLTPGRNIISTAMDYLGTGYRYGGAGPNGFDCSGFVMYVFGKHGISLPHSSGSQADMGTPVDKTGLQPGDLVFFKTGGSSRINHVGIYIGDGRFIHASTNTGITITDLTSGTYASCYVYARRIL